MMVFEKQQFECPYCNSPAIGSDETIPGVALFGEPDAKGDVVQVDYFGETEVDWDRQRQLVDEIGRVSLVCQDRHRWWARREDLAQEGKAVDHCKQMVAALEIAVGMAHWARGNGADRGFIDSFLKMVKPLIKNSD